jgi:hypothetical protein
VPAECSSRVDLALIADTRVVLVMSTIDRRRAQSDGMATPIS